MLCLKKFSWICSTQHPFLCNFLQINVQKFYKWLRHSKQTARETESQDPVNTPTWGKRWSKSFIFTYAKLPVMMLLLLLSHFSRVQLCATPETAAHQASQSLGFSRQEHWSGLPFPSPMHESEKWKVKSESEVAQSCPTLSDPMDCSLPDFSIHGIFQARVLEWGAIAFSKYGSYIMVNLCIHTYTRE